MSEWKNLSQQCKIIRSSNTIPNGMHLLGVCQCQEQMPLGATMGNTTASTPRESSKDCKEKKNNTRLCWRKTTHRTHSHEDSFVVKNTISMFPTLSLYSFVSPSQCCALCFLMCRSTNSFLQPPSFRWTLWVVCA